MAAGDSQSETRDATADGRQITWYVRDPRTTSSGRSGNSRTAETHSRRPGQRRKCALNHLRPEHRAAAVRRARGCLRRKSRTRRASAVLQRLRERQRLGRIHVTVRAAVHQNNGWSGVRPPGADREKDVPRRA
jgi:hypothetical protein